MMWIAIGILFGFSILLWVFLSFSIIKQYRYATKFHDLLPYYVYINLISFIMVSIGSFLMIPFQWDYPYWAFIILFGLMINSILMYFIARWRNCYSLKIYSEFLDELKNPIFAVRLFSDYRNEKTSGLEEDKINVFIRHDVDLSIPRLLNIIKLEREKSLFSTLFFRFHSEKYRFSEVVPLLKKLHSQGFEIGYHYEVLSQTKGDTEEALNLFKKELIEFREIIPLEAVAHHGDKYKNQQIWSLVDKNSLNIWNAYDMERDIYITDTGGNDMIRKHGVHIFKKLNTAKPGDIVQILIHADWWY